jgi:hypothetical protein
MAWVSEYASEADALRVLSIDQLYYRCFKVLDCKHRCKKNRWHAEKCGLGQCPWTRPWIREQCGHVVSQSPENPSSMQNS